MDSRGDGKAGWVANARGGGNTGETGRVGNAGPVCMAGNLGYVVMLEKSMSLADGDKAGLAVVIQRRRRIPWVLAQLEAWSILDKLVPDAVPL